MSTPNQRSFWLRNRFRLFQVYLVLLLLSRGYVHLNRTEESAPPFSPAPPEHIGPPPVTRQLALLDPLDPSAPLLRAYADTGEALYARLPGLNLPDRDPRSLAQLAEEVAERFLHDGRPPVLLLANGHGGAIALYLAARHPEHVAAVVLIDATGVQELSLLGEYHLNYALYAISETSLRLYHNLVPHFNAFPRLRLQQAQIALLRHSDRRTLRPLFASIRQPVLILQHPRENLRQHAALEHERLLPQSHHLPLPENASLAVLLQPFLADLQAGLLPERAHAPPERLSAAERDYDDTDRPRVQGFSLLVLLLAIAVATLITEDLTCALTGLMIANGNLSWAQGMGACVLGILFFDSLIYAMARRLGRPALYRIPLRWLIDPLTLRETETWFDRRVGEAIFITRFIPGTRLPAYVAAGILGVPAKTFLPIFILATLIWTPLILWISVTLAEHALEWIALYQHTAPALIVAALLLYILFSHLLLPACSWRGRRKLLARHRRLTRPEFWPATLLYLPVVLRLLLRSLKRGNHFLDFTACNPAIPGSGFVGESKHLILDQIGERGAIAPYCVLPGGASSDEKLRAAADWMRTNHIPFPVFLKPDVGQRGTGVQKITTAEQLRAAVDTLHGPHLLQEAAQGNEYGVFYVREPGQARGRILAINRKILPFVVGDGRRKLEDLILADDRAAIRHRIHSEQLGDLLYSVPAAGEHVGLTSIGNHARGARFEQGIHLRTPELEARIEAISQSIPGFHLGRYDLFAPSDEALSRGQDLRIVELNGVTSEATSLYAPGCRYRDMVRTLWTSWELACRIGRLNREAGVPLLRMRELLEAFDHYCRQDHARKLRSLECQIADKDCHRPQMK